MSDWPRAPPSGPALPTSCACALPARWTGSTSDSRASKARCSDAGACPSLMEQWVEQALGFITENRFWAGPLIALLAFAESLAFLSVAVPFTGIIIGAGTLVGTGALDPWIVIPWGIAGASLGDAVSYWIGRYFDKAVPRIWPFKN